MGYRLEDLAKQLLGDPPDPRPAVQDGLPLEVGVYFDDGEDEGEGELYVFGGEAAVAPEDPIIGGLCFLGGRGGTSQYWLALWYQLCLEPTRSTTLCSVSLLLSSISHISSMLG